MMKFAGYDDIKVGDLIEAYDEVKVGRSLDSVLAAEEKEND